MPSIKIIILLINLTVVQIGFTQDKKYRLAETMKTNSYNMFDVVVLVAENGKIIYKGAFGLANRKWNIPNKTDTKFMIGSVSKPLTTTETIKVYPKYFLKCIFWNYFIVNSTAAPGSAIAVNGPIQE